MYFHIKKLCASKDGFLLLNSYPFSGFLGWQVLVQYLFGWCFCIPYSGESFIPFYLLSVLFKPLYHITFQPSFTPLLDQFGFSLTNSVSLGIKASFFLLDLLLFWICSRYVFSFYWLILYFPMRNLCSCHIFLERSISLVSNQKKSRSWFQVSRVRYLQFTEQLSICQKVTNLLILV